MLLSVEGSLVAVDVEAVAEGAKSLPDLGITGVDMGCCDLKDRVALASTADRANCEERNEPRKVLGSWVLFKCL